MNRRVLVGLSLLGIGLAVGGGYVIVNARKNGARWSNMIPDARAKADQLEAQANAAGLPVMFWEGWRTPDDEAALMRNPAGVTKVREPLDSSHVWGYGFDFVFRNAAGLPSWPPATDPRWRQLAQIAQQLGLLSGGLTWGWDWPHFQLPDYSTASLKTDWADPAAFLESQGVAIA